MKSFGKGTRTLQEEISGINELLQYIDVDTKTGICTWKKLKPRMKKSLLGSVAGTVSKKGYTSIEYNHQPFQRHRIVFYVSYGYLPLIVDHIHGVHMGDGVDNLQEATNQQNTQKQRKSKNNTSGYRGVYWCKSSEKWQASIRIDGKNNHLGYYDTPEEAHTVYENKAKEVYGDFYIDHTLRELL